MRVGIDLLWVRPGICGGTESFIRSLMNGFALYDEKNEYVLFTASDNGYSFQSYAEYPNMRLAHCPVPCAGQPKRILWENLHLDKAAVREGVDVMFIPVYSKPLSRGSRIPYVSVIHDLQALHYPQYFSRVRRLFLKRSWRFTCRTAALVVTDSDFCKEDLIRHYPFVKEKIQTIYVPIAETGEKADFGDIERKFGVRSGEYYYCVSSMLPHKNLDTVLKTMAALKNRRSGKPVRLVLSGVGGRQREFQELLEELEISDCVVQTGYVSDAERDCLYENCRLFLFPSVFEGFGMPPVEAMRKGKNVVMTKESCLPEVTEGKAVYVDDPYCVEEWVGKIELAENMPGKVEKFEKYGLQSIAEQYIRAFADLF